MLYRHGIRGFNFGRDLGLGGVASEAPPAESEPEDDDDKKGGDDDDPPGKKERSGGGGGGWWPSGVGNIGLIQGDVKPIVVINPEPGGDNRPDLGPPTREPEPTYWSGPRAPTSPPQYWSGPRTYPPEIHFCDEARTAEIKAALAAIMSLPKLQRCFPLLWQCMGNWLKSGRLRINCLLSTDVPCEESEYSEPADAHASPGKNGKGAVIDLCPSAFSSTDSYLELVLLHEMVHVCCGFGDPANELEAIAIARLMYPNIRAQAPTRGHWLAFRDGRGSAAYVGAGTNSRVGHYIILDLDTGRVWSNPRAPQHIGPPDRLGEYCDSSAELIIPF